jgi:hypothetical protein
MFALRLCDCRDGQNARCLGGGSNFNWDPLEFMCLVHVGCMMYPHSMFLHILFGCP